MDKKIKWIGDGEKSGNMFKSMRILVFPKFRKATLLEYVKKSFIRLRLFCGSIVIYVPWWCRGPAKAWLKFLKAAQGLTWTIYSSILHTRLSFWMRLLCCLGTRSESPSRQSRFSELLGRKEKDDSKKQVPKSLDDFMANISSKGNTGSGAGNKKGGTILHPLIFIFC